MLVCVCGCRMRRCHERLVCFVWSFFQRLFVYVFFSSLPGNDACRYASSLLIFVFLYRGGVFCWFGLVGVLRLRFLFA